MSLNKLAAFRYRIIDSILKDQSRVTFNELKSRVGQRLFEDYGTPGGISDRTLYNDLNVMRSDPPRGFSAPIVCEKGLYFYTVKGYSIHNEPLRAEELESIREALGLLKQFGSLPLLDQLSEIVEEAGIEGFHSVDHRNEIIQFDTNPALKGLEKIGALYEAIRKRLVVEVIYLPFNTQTPEHYRCHPYLLKEYRNRWYLIGHVVEAGRIYNLALDRMVSVAKTQRSFHADDLTRVVQRFENIIGVTLPENQERVCVTIKVSNHSLPYILTKPLHASQKLVEKKKDYSIITLEVIPNFELESNLLSFGENVIVIEPVGLKQQLHKRIQLMNECYNQQ